MLSFCDVADRKYGFENPTTDNYLDFCINNGFITPANSRGKMSYCLVAVPDINVDGEDSLTSTIVENPKLVISGSATSSSSLNERGRRQSSNFSGRASLINCDNGGKNSNELANFLKHQIDQNNKIILKILNNNSLVESNLQKSDNSLPKSNKKNPLVEVVKENISKLPKGIKTPKKQKKVTKERKNVFIIGDSMIKGLAERGISKDHNMRVRLQPGCTTEDIEDHIKPILPRNPDAIIIHSGSNDVTNDKPTKNKIKKVVKLIEDTNPNIQVIISGLINRQDREVDDEIASINNQ